VWYVSTSWLGRPTVITGTVAGQLAAAGTTVAYTPVPDADHFTLLPEVAADVAAWLEPMFA